MKDMTLIVSILDRSGSMHTIAEEAVGSYNRFLGEQQALPDYAELTQVQFDDEYELNFSRVPIKDCKPLVLGETYEPRGMTALFDAVGKTINTVGAELAALPEEERPARVLFVIQTDGHENNSKEFSGTKVREMVAHQQEKYNWDFIFLGAGINAQEQGAAIGLHAFKCASFTGDAQGVAQAGHTMTAYATCLRGGRDRTTMRVEDFRPKDSTSAR